MKRLDSLRRWCYNLRAMENQNGIAAVLLIPALAIAYYFGIALPENQKAHLALEKQKYQDEQNRRAEAEQQRATNETLLESCLGTAETDYWTYVKLNGQPVPGKPDTYTAPIHIWDSAAKNKKDAIEECHRRYGHGN